MPAATPVIIPNELTVAIEELLTDQLPPDTDSVSVPVLPAHSVEGPLMAANEGVAFTLTNTLVAAVPHVLVTEYEILTEPALQPVTTPVALTVAIVVSPVDQVPPADVSVSVIVEPVQTEVVEATIAPTAAPGFTVIKVLVERDPQLLEIV